ncbi:membrane-spanning 4-domains subfamily A member 4A-like [Peromyscus eremicus]|uniref:membrane-spanning 4-domains subfamily A member 4A-like n=1 Tax=Peromyscus eremicus TaxID=42410 RepID=UPI0027DDAB06|nr:membrane-spanning 4-domains subfamily A member 4A-like [Peromyscus eremicus]
MTYHDTDISKETVLAFTHPMVGFRRRTVSAAMITIQGIEHTALEDGYDAQKVGQQPLYVNSLSWKRMTEKFLKGEPKILGVVQIVIALMNLSIGITMISAIVPAGGVLPVSVYIGYPVWGSLMFIISGSFSIVAGRRTTKGLVRSSLGLNITSSVFAISGIIISSLSPGIYSFHFYYCTYRSSSESCLMTMSILIGLDIVVVILSVLEFCIAVSLSAFGCRVMCCNPGGVVVIMPSSPPTKETPCPISL